MTGLHFLFFSAENKTCYRHKNLSSTHAQKKGGKGPWEYNQKNIKI